MDHGTKHAVQPVRSDLLRVDRAHCPARRMADLDRPKRPVRPSAELNRLWDQLGHPSAEPVQLGVWPSWIEHATSSAESSSADGRAGSNTQPARPSAKLN
ncbi:hypothetical protein F2Q69_00006635 [Brassica cretica]|uniref:Uncharacterized protein n=1 Tax=Brassica cretica TaxID=69181 RepID=A0A8S9NZV1_BRACR|nr:hypothetical protein F2Q69_00006635 [Brassica cretica]